MRTEGSIPPCEQFTVVASRTGGVPAQCDVCDHPEAAHATAGRRVLSGAEIEELRRRKLIELFEHSHGDAEPDGELRAGP